MSESSASRMAVLARRAGKREREAHTHQPHGRKLARFRQREPLAGVRRPSELVSQLAPEQLEPVEDPQSVVGSIVEIDAKRVDAGDLDRSHAEPGLLQHLSFQAAREEFACLQRAAMCLP